MITGTAKHVRLHISGVDPKAGEETNYSFWADEDYSCDYVLRNLLRESNHDLIQMLEDYGLDSEFLLEAMGAEQI